MSFKLINENFSCIDSLQQGIKNIGFKSLCTQLGKGKLNSKLLIVEINKIIFIRMSLDKVSFLRGAKPEGYLFFGYTLNYQGKNLQVHGYETPQNYLYGMNPNLETYSLTPEKLEMVVILVPQYIFFNTVKLMGREDLDEKLLKKNWLRIELNNQEELATYFKQLFYLVEYQKDFFNNKTTQKLVCENFLPLLINSLIYLDKIKSSNLKPLKRIEFIKKADEWINENIDKPITLQDIYSALNISKRTLVYSFQDIFGMSPMNYVKKQRLNGVYRDLLKYNSNLVTVGEIARKWGFWSLGHFTRDYKTMFNELPSETLQLFLKSEKKFYNCD